jgi:superfamily II DNA/RNA helicase
MTNSERDSGLERFRQGAVRVLIASKVLLAGVSLATANILIIMVSFCGTLGLIKFHRDVSWETPLLSGAQIKIMVRLHYRRIRCSRNFSPSSS